MLSSSPSRRLERQRTFARQATRSFSDHNDHHHHHHVPEQSSSPAQQKPTGMRKFALDVLGNKYCFWLAIVCIVVGFHQVFFWMLAHAWSILALPLNTTLLWTVVIIGFAYRRNHRKNRKIWLERLQKDRPYEVPLTVKRGQELGLEVAESHSEVVVTAILPKGVVDDWNNDVDRLNETHPLPGDRKLKVCEGDVITALELGERNTKHVFPTVESFSSDYRYGPLSITLILRKHDSEGSMHPKACAPAWTKRDREMALAAVLHDPQAYEWLSDELRDDADVRRIMEENEDLLQRRRQASAKKEWSSCFCFAGF